MNGRTWVTLGAVLGFLAVAGGAFAAHYLKDVVKLEPASLETFRTGARYAMYHALALVLLGLLAARAPSRACSVSGVAFCLGVLLFTGSLWGLALTGAKWLGPITPLGGVCFLVGWVSLAIAAKGLGTPEKPA